MRLYLVQHAEACPKEVDPDRPLTDAGRRDADRLAAFLGRAGIRAGRVLHSGKLRARETAERLAAAVAPSVELEESGLLGPKDNPGAFDWQSDSWTGDTLVVGHLPFLARLVAHLVVDDDARALVAFEPGSIVCLERAEAGRWRIDWMVRPELLRA